MVKLEKKGNYVPYVGAVIDVDLGDKNLSANALTLGSGLVLSAGKNSANTLIDFQANYNSGDDAFRMQFHETGTYDAPLNGGYIQYNSDANYLEFGGIDGVGVDQPGFYILRENGKSYFLGDAEFQGEIDIWNSLQIGRYTEATSFTIAGDTNLANCARINIWEQENLGAFMRYDGDSNKFYIGTNPSSTDTDAIEIARGSTTVSFLGDITTAGGIISTGSIATSSYFQNVGSTNKIRLGYDDATKGYTYADSSGHWHHKPYSGLNYFDTSGVNNFFFIYDYTQPSSSYSAIGGDYWGITYQTSLNVKLNGNGLSWINGGNLGIGTNTASEKLEVDGNVLAKELISANSGTVNRTSGVITSVAVTGGRTLTPTYTDGLITSLTDGTRTWTFTYTDGVITSWSVS